MGIRLEAWKDFWNHYKTVFKASWKHRHEMEPPKLLAHEAQFLPAALSLVETPVSPAPRVAMWLIIAFATLALGWSIFGKIDVVATAQGKVVSNDRTKVIQSLEPAIVRAIYVRDGQRVKEGDLLIELDATQAQADVARLQNDLGVARLQVARANAILASLEANREMPLERPLGVSDADYNEALMHYRGQYNEYQARVLRMTADFERNQADQSSVRESVSKLEKTIPITRTRVSDLADLLKDNYIPRHQYEEARQELLGQEGDLKIQRERLKQSEAAVLSAASQLRELSAEMRRVNLDQVAEGRQKETTCEQELKKAQTRSQQLRLTAPVAGMVQQLSVHTVGGVVQQAQQLMVVVPENEALEVEAFLENRDIGFVRVGQEAEIKVETFQYTKYGIIPGEVIFVSEDAIPDEKRGLIYQTLIRLSKSTMQVGEREVNLSPGMNVTAEIKTDQRRVIEYFLTPLLNYKKSTLKER